MEDFLIIAVPTAIVIIGAVVGVLKIVAPRTPTTRDDKALEVFERIERALAIAEAAQAEERRVTEEAE